MRLIDSHCHLNYEGLVERQDEVLDNARKRGVEGFLNISTRQSEWGDISGVTGVLHCFTGSAELAKKALDLGFFISLSGIVTFKNARDLQHTARQVPLDSLLVETDSPFLAPVPHRGQKCEPAFVADTASFVA